MNQRTAWKVCRESRARYYIQMMVDPDYGIISVLVRRPPDYVVVQEYPKGTPKFWRFHRMYHASCLIAEFPNVTDLSVAA
jgi:hypothetical protein